MNPRSSRALRAVSRLAAALGCCASIALGAACNPSSQTGETPGCPEGNVRCSGSVRQVCDAVGIWNDTLCPHGCDNGACLSCTPSKDTRCSGNTLQSCNSDAQWEDDEVCALGCKEGSCTVCAPGSELRCQSNTVEECNEDGQWQPQGVCTQACIDGHCAACLPGKDVQCVGNVAQRCNELGNWEDEQTCLVLCAAGKCLPCVPGALRCEGDAVQTCSADGQWEVTLPCPPCTGCSNIAAECVTNQPDGAICDDADSCTKHDTCQGGSCTGQPLCTSLDPCGTGACEAATGTCVSLPDGTACDDGDICSPSESCQAGTCQGGDHAAAHWEPGAAPADPRFVAMEHIVIDTLTGLIWQRELEWPPVMKDWAGAKAHCAALSLPGYPSGFRLPTRVELASIVDYEKATAPTLDEEVFLGIEAAPADAKQHFFWTASPRHGSNPAQAWTVYFKDGSILYPETVIPLRVRCAR